MRSPVIIGNATHYLGDCLEILPTLESGSVQLVVTSRLTMCSAHTAVSSRLLLMISLSLRGENP